MLMLPLLYSVFLVVLCLGSSLEKRGDVLIPLLNSNPSDNSGAKLDRTEKHKLDLEDLIKEYTQQNRLPGVEEMLKCKLTESYTKHIQPPVKNIRSFPDNYLIYPNSDVFKHYVGPYLTSDLTLKMFEFFRQKKPGLSIAKFLPYSAIDRGVNVVFDWKKYYFGYFVEAETYDHPLLDPILFDLEDNFQTLSFEPKSKKRKFRYSDYIHLLHDVPSNFVFPGKYAIFAINSETNGIEELHMEVFGDSKILFHNLSDDQDRKMIYKIVFLLKNCKIVPIFQGYVLSMSSDTIVKVMELSWISRIYFALFDLFDMYFAAVTSTRYYSMSTRLYFDIVRDVNFSLNLISKFFKLPVLSLMWFPIKILSNLPFSILSLPFQYWIFQQNFDKYTQYFLSTLVLPNGIEFISVLFYLRVCRIRESGIKSSIRNVRSPWCGFRWACEYYESQKPTYFRQSAFSLKEYAAFIPGIFFFIFSVGLAYSVQFMPLLLLFSSPNGEFQFE